jgi:hypothetical protein
MPPRLLAALCLALAVTTLAGPSRAWIENAVLGDEIRIEVDRSGEALVEHRLTLKTNGSERLKRYEVRGVDPDARPLDNSYAVPARDALSSSLDAAVPLHLELVAVKPRSTDVEGSTLGGTALRIDVADPRGLRRGTYVLVLRYRTSLRARGLLQRAGAFTSLRWTGPMIEDGFDNPRVIFVLPAAPTAPRAVEGAGAEEDGDDGPSGFLSEVRRGQDHDEVEILRTYAPQQMPITWVVSMDPRALGDAVGSEDAGRPAASGMLVLPVAYPVRDLRALALGAAAFLFYAALVALRCREVGKRAREAGAMVPGAVPLPAPLRVLLAASGLTAGLALQLEVGRPLAGAACVVAGALLAAHGTARMQPSMRGPGRWLAVSVAEGLGMPPRPRGAWLDASTRGGKAVLLLLLAGAGGLAAWIWRSDRYAAVLVGLDVLVALLAVFGTGRASCLPADMAVEPARFLRPLAERLRAAKKDLRLVPRVRVPHGEVDPDEVRLLVAPRVPVRGFGGIEIGVTYAVGFGARVAMPEVLLRMVAGSPCDEATSALARFGRVTRGRKPDERVIAFAPRFPTVRMTAAIVAALVARVTERSPVARPATKSAA